MFAIRTWKHTKSIASLADITAQTKAYDLAKDLENDQFQWEGASHWQQFFLNTPTELIEKVLPHLSSPHIRAQLFYLLWEHFLSKDKNNAPPLILDWCEKISLSLGIDAKIDEPLHISEFNQKIAEIIQRDNSKLSTYCKPLDYACPVGIVPLARLGLFWKLKKEFGLYSRSDLVLVTAIKSALVNGHLLIVKWLCMHLQVQNKLVDILKDEDTFNIFNDVAARGHVEVMQWMFAQLAAPDKLLALQGFGAFKEAAKNYHFKLARWIYELNNGLKANALAALADEDESCAQNFKEFLTADKSLEIQTKASSTALGLG